MSKAGRPLPRGWWCLVQVGRQQLSLTPGVPRHPWHGPLPRLEEVPEYSLSMALLGPTPTACGPIPLVHLMPPLINILKLPVRALCRRESLSGLTVVFNKNLAYGCKKFV